MGWIKEWMVLCLLGLAFLPRMVFIVVGLRHNKQHIVSRSLQLKQSAEAIWTVITDHANEPTWFKDLKSSRQLPDNDGQPVWEIRYKRLSPPMKLTTTVSEPPCKLIRTYHDYKVDVTFQWGFKLAPQYGATVVTITEYTEIPSVYGRDMFHLFRGPAMYPNLYLKALAEKFGEHAAVSGW